MFLISLAIFALLGLAPEGYRITNFAFDDPTRGLVLNEEDVIPLDKYIEKTPDKPEVKTYTRPDRITIERIGVDSHIEKPLTRNVTQLDQFLSQGPVHYPGSGAVEEGNMFIFGHSADAFGFVPNPALRVFNKLDKLEGGDIIKITANDKVYSYEVTNVFLADSNQALIEFDNSKRTLTLSTCDTFGRKQDRWIVEAELVG